jgi:ABC-2 type transport system ATP-binding protein
VVDGEHLSTWSIRGERLAELSAQLEQQPGVDQTVVFGSALHVTGRDAAALEKSVTRVALAAGLDATPIETGIEDVFIHLMNESGAADRLRAP